MVFRAVCWILVLLVFAFFVWAFIREGDQVDAHNRQQIAECRELGGFAQTDVDGHLEHCSR